MGSLQDALLNSGLASEDQKKPDKPGRGKGGRSKPDSSKSNSSKPDRGRGRKARSEDPQRPGNDRRGRGKGPDRRSGSGGGRARPSDLERAWAARRRAEKAEKEREKQARVADQEARRKRNLELDRIVEGRALNDETAELPRYFEHLGRIRRVLCTPEQRTAINRGELGIVGLRGRYLIVEPDVAERYRAVADDLVPDLSGREPEAGDGGDWPEVPDDLTW